MFRKISNRSDFRNPGGLYLQKSEKFFSIFCRIRDFGKLKQLAKVDEIW